MKKTLLHSVLAVLALALYANPVSAQSAGAVFPVISEIMYNPPEPGQDSLEFIEFYNPDVVSPLDMSGYYFSSGVVHTFPSGTIIPAGGFLVVAVDSVAFESVFGMPALQWTSGGLSNSGEAITIRTALGVVADTVYYDDNADWPAEADQGGASLVLCDLASDNNLPSSWAASTNDVGFFSNGMDTYADPYEHFPCITVGVVNNEKELGSNIYPNPTDGNFEMRYSTLEKEGTLDVFNTMGQVVYTQTLAVGGTSVNLDLPLQGGLYVVNITVGNTTEQHRLIVK